MPRAGFSLVVRNNRLEVIAAQIATRRTAAVDQTASDIRDRCEQTAPRDTGSLAASWYTSNGDASDYSQRAGTARSLNGQAEIVEEVRPEFVLSLFGDNSGYIVVVASAVGHAVFQELGTRHMSPQPTLIPATEANREAFIQAMGHVADA